MFARPRMLSILTTRRCTAACDHCCVGAGPRETAAIPISRIHRLIDEAACIPTIKLITFTGGECFLLGADLDDLVGRAAEAGFTTRVITNGYWARNEVVARERVTRLRSRGLAEMMLSTGMFHQQFVPVERIVHGARAAAGAGILTRISIEECDQADEQGATIRSELAGLIASKRVYLGYDPWTTDAGGRGKAPVTHERLLAREPERATGRCAQITTVVSVTPNQELIACCGFPQEELPRLRIGSVIDRTLGDVLDDAPNELLKMWLHVAGPSGIVEFVAQHVPGFVLPPSATICQSCVALQRNDIAMRAIAEHGGEVAQLVVNEFVRLHSGAEPVFAA